MKVGVTVKNAYPLVDVSVVGCRIYRCTILINPMLVDNFRKMGAEFLSYVQDEVEDLK